VPVVGVPALVAAAAAAFALVVLAGGAGAAGFDFAAVLDCCALLAISCHSVFNAVKLNIDNSSHALHVIVVSHST
jgi:hypothetical protein